MRRVFSVRLLLALATLVVVAAPAVAAGLPACCVPVTSAETKVRAACCAMKNAPCCKPVEAPKPDAAAGKTSPAVAASAVAPIVIAAMPTVAPAVEAARLARHQHLAPSPDDSPPDRLHRHRALLI